MTTDGGNRSLGAPAFDVVLRGYDRRQVDEHVARLQRVVARMRSDLELARSRPLPVVPPDGFPAAGPSTPPSGRPRPSPRPRPEPPRSPDESPDMIGSFTDRMHAILQAAEEEAAEIRNQAQTAVRSEEEIARAQIADLVRQRDGVLAELIRLRGQLEGLLAAPVSRIGIPQPAPSNADAPASRPSPLSPAQNEESPSSGTPGSGSQGSGSGVPGAGEQRPRSPTPGSGPSNRPTSSARSV